ncbi:MAG: hypothetical protein JO360_18770 [Acidobacteria bacterium]|nr:hypothetical protein [Acidobacteriota bacterium]
MIRKLGIVMALVLTMFAGSAVFAATPKTPGQNSNMAADNGMKKSSGRRRHHRRRHGRKRKSMSKSATNANTR